MSRAKRPYRRALGAVGWCSAARRVASGVAPDRGTSIRQYRARHSLDRHAPYVAAVFGHAGSAPLPRRSLVHAERRLRDGSFATELRLGRRSRRLPGRTPIVLWGQARAQPRRCAELRATFLDKRSVAGKQLHLVQRFARHDLELSRGDHRRAIADGAQKVQRSSLSEYHDVEGDRQVDAL